MPELVGQGGAQAVLPAPASKLTTYQVTKLSEFVGKLAATPDGEGTLLVGGANGKLQGNRRVVAKPTEPTANLLLALADLAGCELKSIGASTGRLAPHDTAA